MNPDGGAVPQTFKIASPDDKKSPSEPVAGEPATVALPKMGENPIPPKAVASSKISSRILGKDGHSTSDRKQCSILARSSRLVWLRVGSKQITVLSGGIRCAH